MKISVYHVLIGLVVLLFLIGLFSPLEKNYPGIEGNDNFTDNFTNMSQPADQSSLMSTPDNVQSDEKGWWKHEGHSTLIRSNTSASSIGDESLDSTDNENEDREEIPEFPSLMIPFIAAIGIAMFFTRK